MGIGSQWSVTLFVAGLWVVSLLYGEMLAFWVPLFSCSWPAIRFDGTKAEDAPVRPIKIALIADPRITHEAGSIASLTTLKFSEFYSDIYMRRAFRSSVLQMYPDRIIFLGDLLEGGHILSDPEWEAMHKRFEHVFDQSQRGYNKGSGPVPVFYLPGSQDLGSAQLQLQRPEIRNRNEAAFGPLEHVVVIGGIEFLFTNARAFGLEFSIKANATWGLLKKISSDDEVHSPRLLFTASPLYKSSDTPCRMQRMPEKNDESVTAISEPLHVDKSQEYLTLETTTSLLNLTKPMMVFSAHSHQGCSMKHTTSFGSIVEHTVGTFNWQQENLHPSFMMISIAPELHSGSLDLVTTSVCFLPVQIWIYTWYIFSFLTGVLAIFCWPVYGVHISATFAKVYQYLREIFGPDSVKAKDEDADNGDWEMMWDAEGAMHLIKAKKVVPVIKNTTQGGDRRGTTFARSTAKRQGAVDTETIVTVESNFSYGRTTRTRTRMSASRFCQALGPLAVLMSWNFSLYMMLLMKDWT